MSAQSPGSLTVQDVLPASDEETLRTLADTIASNLRVAMPGIIQSFNPAEMTVTVQPAIMERIRQPDLTLDWTAIPILVDVPVVLPSAGGFMLTLPIQPGDECLLVFSDMCIDAWWDQGGSQNTQPDKRRHDLSDAVALVGIWSKPNVPANYSTTSAQLRNKAGTQYVEITDSAVNLVGSVYANGVPIT